MLFIINWINTIVIRVLKFCYLQILDYYYFSMKYYEQMEFTTIYRNFIHKTSISDDSENRRLTEEQQNSQNT